VTGAGIVTALGLGWRKNAEGFRVGRTAFRDVTLFDVSRQRARQAAEVDLPATALPATPSKKAGPRIHRASRMLLFAGQEAWNQAGWETGENIPLILGTTSGEMPLGEAYLRKALASPRSNRLQPTRMVHYQAQQSALELCNALGFSGPVTIIANACASGANAIGHAWEMVRRGTAQRVLTGGYDALCQLTFAGFDSLQALSVTRCQPFGAGRDGLSLGEGAAVLAIETLEQASRRQATILGEIIGYGVATDTHHITQPHPEGKAAVSAMNTACATAGVSPGDVDYVNAHGTGTLHNDSAEGAALLGWAGARAGTLPVSSTKAGIGHLLGAAGAVEALVCLMSLREQWLPPQTTVEEVDPACRFRLVRQPEQAKMKVALSNSFGFGGSNATLLFRRWS
jgi:3-oxoacyl-[acyl-carrier-protein] synthase II